MENRAYIIIACIILLILVVIFYMIGTKKLDLKYSLSWICLLTISFILDLCPDFLLWLSQLLGIELPSNMVFAFGIFFLSIVVFLLTLSFSRLSNKTKRLIQEIALLQEEVEQLRKEKNNIIYKD